MTTEPMSNSTNELVSLAGRLDRLEQEILMLRDAHEIANLQARYLYYLQAHQYEKIVELFAHREPVSIEMDNLGRFFGRDKVTAVFTKVLQPLYTMKGAMGLHMLTTPVVEVHPDRRHAWGMWHTFGCNTQPDFVGKDTEVSAEPELIALWQQGKYFIDFIREDGEWKWQNFRWYVNFRTPYDAGDEVDVVEGVNFGSRPHRRTSRCRGAREGSSCADRPLPGARPRKWVGHPTTY